MLDKINTKLKSALKENKQTIILSALLIVGAFIYYLIQKKELSDYGSEVDAKVVSFKNIRRNGACIANIEYTTIDGQHKAAQITLYNDTNCRVGRKLRIEYSAVSDLINVIEIPRKK